MEKSEIIESILFRLEQVGIKGLLERPDITDIEINSGSKSVFIEGRNGREKTDIKIDRGRLEGFLNSVAEFVGSDFTRLNPTLSAILPAQLKRCRLEASMAPITKRTNVVIRKPGQDFPLSDYIDDKYRQIIIDEMMKRANILICGSTSSGKTSFLNSLLEEFKSHSPDERIIILEDENEVNCTYKNHEFLFTVKDERGQSWTMADNVKKSLRLNPDRIIVGEVRGIEAREVLTAWDTGHGGGMCTFHAGSAKTGFMRFFRMAELNWGNPLDQMFAGEAVGLIVFLSKGKDGRKVREIVSVKFNYDPDKMRPEFTYLYKQ